MPKKTDPEKIYLQGSNFDPEIYPEEGRLWCEDGVWDESVEYIRADLHEKRIAELKEELLVAEKLLEQRQRVLNAIPDCPTHGANCVPHAVEWIHQAKTRHGQE